MASESIRRFASEQSAGFLRSLMLDAGHAAKSGGIEAVHDLRVSIRRFRQVLKVFRAWLPRNESHLLRHEMKEIMKHAGDVRDRDIAIALLRKIQAPANRRVVAEIHEQRGVSAHALQESLRDFRRRGSAAAWRRALKLVQDSGKTSARDAASNILPGMLKKYLRHGTQASHHNASSKELHRFRIATKEIRYSVELFIPVFGAGAGVGTGGPIGELSKNLKKIQNHLGAIHDCTATAALIEDLKSPGRKNILRAIGKRGEEKTDRFLRDYRRQFEDEDAVRRWKKALRHP
ncbi:MAG TPA: CHAD domain-containing protein [Bryobacteraceae bacterium]|nr:CHAD domain-containing protein [Bryobacteraceae bacterium]